MEIFLGALAPKLSEQLKGVKIKREVLDHLQKDADALSRLHVRELITYSETVRARKKLIKKISKAVSR